MSDSKGPTHRVYDLIPRPTKEEPNNVFWNNIGAAFPNADGKGFNVVLDAIPIPRDGKIRLVIREIKEDEPEEQPPQRGRTSARR